MFDQGILERPIIFPLNMRSVNLNLEVPYRRVATAIDGDPREPSSHADIYAIDGKEYLVPEQRRHEKGELVESIVRLDLAKLILSRPTKSRQIGDMKLSSDVPLSVRAVLAKAVEEFNPTHFDYAVQIIRPQL